MFERFISHFRRWFLRNRLAETLTFRECHELKRLTGRPLADIVAGLQRGDPEIGRALAEVWARTRPNLMKSME